MEEELSLKNKTVKGVVWQSVNTFGNMLVGFVTGIILARQLLPSDYGAITMVGVFTSIITLFTDGGLTTAIVRKENRTEDDMCTIFYYNFFATYVAYGIIFLIAPFIADFYKMPVLCSLTRVLSIPMLIGAFASMQHVHFTINLDFKTPALIALISNILNAVISIWMAYNGYGVWSLAIPSIFVAAFRTLLTISVVRWRPTRWFSWKSFRELFGFSSKLLLTSIVDRIYINITPLLIGKFYSPAQLGYVNKAESWPNLAAGTINGILQSVTFPVLSKLQNDVSVLRRNYRRILRFTAFVTFPLVIGLAAVAKPLTIVILTEKWVDSAHYMQIICLFWMWAPIQSINQNLLTVTGNSQYLLKNMIIRRICSLIIMAMTLPFGIVCYLWGMVAMSYISLYVNSYYSKRIINYGIFEQMRDYWKILLNCVIMWAIVVAVMSVFDNIHLKLFVGSSAGAVCYILNAYLLNRGELNEMLDMLQNKLPFLKRK